jgi:predicted O-methyltransferase YrrM
MYKAERNALYRIIRETKPDYCFEIGTYTDGGSTFFISKALKDNNKGRLITMESDEFLHNKAKTRYKKYIKSQYPYIEFVRTSYPFIFEKYLQEKNKKIMISLDGAKDGKQTLEQYNYFLPYFHKGTILIAHDWNTEKTRLLKPLILNSGKWEIKIELRPPLSIGFIIAEML